MLDHAALLERLADDIRAGRELDYGSAPHVMEQARELRDDAARELEGLPE
jgi:hypothetical protein